VGDVVDMPKPRDKKWSTKIESHSIDADVIREVTSRISGKQGVIVAGRGASRDVLVLAEALGWPVLADPRSGVRECHPLVVIGFDSILRSERFVQAVSPDVVLRIGETPASKVLAQWVTNSNAEVVQIRAWHNVSDPDHHVALTAVGDVSQIVLGAASQVQRCRESWLSYWSRAEVAAQSVLSDWIQQHMSEPTVARTVTDNLEVGSYLVVSSSMPIRDVEWFGTVTPGVEVLSNRGANGIDGVVSTAVGVALATSATVTLLIGDIACIHDSNGLWGLMNRDVDVRIVVTNNDGGSIFSFLPQASMVGHEIFETLYGTPHGVSFSHLAAAHAVPYASVDTADELVMQMTQKGPRLIEVALDRSVNVDQHNEINAAVAKAVDTTV
jgi:2-succinyl-5-enolpyruvyl-6-hydroxy-3-cyclohexene-1-carboxylate synthase